MNPYRVLSFSGIACLVYFFSAVVLLHFLDREFDPIYDFVSMYGGGEYAWLAQSAFTILNLGFVCIWAALILRFGKMLAAWVPISAFSVAFTGLAVLTAHPVDWTDYEALQSVIIHDQAATVGFISIIVGQVLWSLLFLITREFRRFSLPLVVISVSNALYFFIQGPRDIANIPHSQIGFHQRICIAGIWVWMLACALRLRKETEHLLMETPPVAGSVILPNFEHGTARQMELLRSHREDETR